MGSRRLVAAIGYACLASACALASLDGYSAGDKGGGADASPATEPTGTTERDDDAAAEAASLAPGDAGDPDAKASGSDGAVEGGGAPTVLVGFDAVAPTDDSVLVGAAEAFVYTAKASGTARRIALFVRPGSTATKVSIGVYASSGSAATTLLAQATISPLVADGWNIVDLADTPIVKNTQYWIAVTPANGTVNIRSTTNTMPSYGFQGSGLTKLPSDWLNGDSYDDAPLSAYVTD